MDYHFFWCHLKLSQRSFKNCKKCCLRDLIPNVCIELFLATTQPKYDEQKPKLNLRFQNSLLNFTALVITKSSILESRLLGQHYCFIKSRIEMISPNGLLTLLLITYIIDRISPYKQNRTTVSFCIIYYEIVSYLTKYLFISSRSYAQVQRKRDVGPYI